MRRRGSLGNCALSLSIYVCRDCLAFASYQDSWTLRGSLSIILFFTRLRKFHSRLSEMVSKMRLGKLRYSKKSM